MEEQKSYYERNKEKRKEYQRKYYNEHKAKEKERKKQWRVENKDRIREYYRKWRKSNYIKKSDIENLIENKRKLFNFVSIKDLKKLLGE